MLTLSLSRWNHRSTQSDAPPALPNANPLRSGARRKSGSFCQRKSRTPIFSCNQLRRNIAQTSRKHPTVSFSLYPMYFHQSVSGSALSELASKFPGLVAKLKFVDVVVAWITGRFVLRFLSYIKHPIDAWRRPKPTQAGECNTTDTKRDRRETTATAQRHTSG